MTGYTVPFNVRDSGQCKSCVAEAKLVRIRVRLQDGRFTISCGEDLGSPRIEFPQDQQGESHWALECGFIVITPGSESFSVLASHRSGSAITLSFPRNVNGNSTLTGHWHKRPDGTFPSGDDIYFGENLAEDSSKYFRPMNAKPAGCLIALCLLVVSILIAVLVAIFG